MVYVGGAFTSFGSGAEYPRDRLAAFDTGSLTPSVPTDWAPSADVSVTALAVSGSTVYAGGNFTTIDDAKGGGEQGRGHLAAVDSSGNLSAGWIPSVGNVPLVEIISTLAVSNNTVYVGGTFVTVNDNYGSGDVARWGIAAFGTDGSLSSWAPDADSSVYAINVTEFGGAASVNVGGKFNNINGEIALFCSTLAPAP